jgi:predicted metalloprotease with PDZ domain
MSLDFTLDASEPATRHLGVSLEFDREPNGASADAEVVLFLPVWTPGSYLVREYSRHLSRVAAEDAATGRSLACRKLAKNRFAVEAPAGVRRLRVRYRVYAHELSVRTSDLTAEHAYWNHACVLLWPLDRTGEAAELRVIAPAGWDLACSLPQRPAAPAQAPRPDTACFTLQARNLDHAVDSPCLLGRFTKFEWSVDGVPHAVVLDGLGAIQPPASLVDDLAVIVRTAQAVWGGALPYDRYLFQCLFAGEGHGGLEHSDSTTLLMARTALRSDKGYREFLSLAAHELFHAWNVKRLRPAEFWRYDYETENYTSLLWLIEGWTAYYDDLLCVRAGFWKPEDYLAELGKTLAAMRNAPGRFQLSLAESSFDAWIRLYRPDENTRNSSQNYYGNGSIAALCLDLSIRRGSAGARCLDDVLRDLYRTTFDAGRGYTLGDVQAAVERAMGPEAREALRCLTEGSLDPDLPALLDAFGVKLTTKDSERPHLGITFDAGRTTIASVNADAPANLGGLMPGDEILAIQDLRVDSDRWQDVFQAVATVGAPLDVLVARRGAIVRARVVPAAGPGTPQLELDPKATTEQLALRKGWLPSPPPKVEARPAGSAPGA